MRRALAVTAGILLRKLLSGVKEPLNPRLVRGQRALFLSNERRLGGILLLKIEKAQITRLRFRD
jgi:hypothetical protein